MHPRTHRPPTLRPGAVVAGVALVALAAALAWTLAGPGDGLAQPGVVLAPRAPADAALASPFGAMPWTGPSAVPAVAGSPPAALPQAGARPAPALPPAGHDRPTLEPAERALAHELLAAAPPLDAAATREEQALLFHDGVLRVLALREAGESGPELAALLQQLRAALPAQEAAADLAPEVLAAARAALAGASPASPFAAPR